MRADAEKLERVVVNGVRNAVQAMGGGGSAARSPRAGATGSRSGSRTRGEGIAPEALPKLFTPFYTTRATGTGLGLAYAKKVVEGMGGTIELENRATAAGAVFTVLLPRARGAAESGPTRSTLVVEDDALMRSFLVDVLAARGLPGGERRRTGRPASPASSGTPGTWWSPT